MRGIEFGRNIKSGVKVIALGLVIVNWQMSLSLKTELNSLKANWFS